MENQIIDGNIEPNRQNEKNDDFKKYINKIYGEEYFNIETKLNSIKESSKSYFNNISSEYCDKCQNLMNEYYVHFSKITEKIKNSFELENQATGEKLIDDKTISLIQNYSKTYLTSFNSILEMNDQIFDNIKQNMNILINLIDISSKSLDKENPTHTFLDKEFKNIINNWMFLKIKFENYDFVSTLNNEDINEQLKDLIFKVCENKTFYMDINNHNKIPEEIFIQNLNRSNNQLSCLKLNEISDISKYFTQDVQYPNLKSLEIKNVEIDNIQFLKKFPNLEKLNINLCLDLELSIFEFLPSNNITELYFIKNGLINSEFNKIISDYLVKNDSIRKNLKILSFEDNNLSKIDFNQMIFTSKQSFYSLKELNFEKNKIYKFSLNPELFPALKFINLCYNNFTSSCFNEYKDTVVLLSGSAFLMDNVLCANYYSELERKLNKTPLAIKNLCLSYGPKSFSEKYITNVRIDNSLLVNLLYLDLSFNHMNCDTFFSFIKNNKRILNIKSFNLSGNELDDTFFEKYLENNYYNMFQYLENLDLNNNLIGGENDIIYKDEAPIKEDYKSFEKIIYKLRLIYKFINENKNLKLISITRNPICKYFKIIESNEEEIKNSVLKNGNDKIIINCFYSFLLKIKKELIEGNIGEKRQELNIKFDCRAIINQDLMNFKFDQELIIFKINI